MRSGLSCFEIWRTDHAGIAFFRILVYFIVFLFVCGTAFVAERSAAAAAPPAAASPSAAVGTPSASATAAAGRPSAAAPSVAAGRPSVSASPSVVAATPSAPESAVASAAAESVAATPPAASAAAESPPVGQTLKVGVYVSPPFVMTTDGGLYSGMAILLWEKLEHRLGLTSEYVSYTSFQDFLAAPGKGEVDLLLTNLTVTHERAKSLKFSYPWYDGGMRILVSTESPPSLWDGLKRSGQLHAYAWMAGILVLLTALHTLIHRRLLHDFPDRWLDGFSLSLYELTQNVRGNVNLKSMEYLGWFKHVLGAVWMLCGVAVVAYITSSVTSTMTASSLQQSSISSLADLKDKKTAVLQGSAGEEYLRKLNLRVVPQPNLEAAIAARARIGDDRFDMKKPELTQGTGSDAEARRVEVAVN